MNLKEIMKQWKDEAGVKSHVLIQYFLSKGELKIMTNRPGSFIGLHGVTYDKYKKLLEENIPRFKSLDFIETTDCI